LLLQELSVLLLTSIYISFSPGNFDATVVSLKTCKYFTSYKTLYPQRQQQVNMKGVPLLINIRSLGYGKGTPRKKEAGRKLKTIHIISAWPGKNLPPVTHT